MGHSLWGHKESDKTEHAHTHISLVEVYPPLPNSLKILFFISLILPNIWFNLKHNRCLTNVELNATEIKALPTNL